MKLYYSPKTRATRARWMLEEIGAPHEIVRVDMKSGAHKQPDYVANVHPLGKVPALDDDGLIIFESQAICLYLADRFPEANLAPRAGDGLRGLYLQWMAFALGTIEPALFKVWLTKDDAEAQKKAKADLARIVEVVEVHLGKSPYMAGSAFSAADVMTGALLGWALDMDLVQSETKVSAWIERIRSRPGYVRAHAD